jgi:hypothetical protein
MPSQATDSFVSVPKARLKVCQADACENRYEARWILGALSTIGVTLSVPML